MDTTHNQDLLHSCVPVFKNQDNHWKTENISTCIKMKSSSGGVLGVQG